MISANTYGLVVCGGKSSRMGTEKCSLIYRDKPQHELLCNMLHGLCPKTFISCSQLQLDSLITNHTKMADLPAYESVGPMAALLTAFAHFPENDFLVLACDYPFLTAEDLKDFSNHINHNCTAAAFYHESAGLYEPLLAWYSHRSAGLLSERARKGRYSLQHFLREIDAEKYKPQDANVMTSIDTPEGMQLTKSILNHN